MAKHRIGIERELMARGAHVMLVREPSAVIQSFGEVLEPTLQETCYPALCEIYSELRSAGWEPYTLCPLSCALVRPYGSDIYRCECIKALYQVATFENNGNALENLSG